GSGYGDIDEITAKTAQKYRCTVIASGPTDTISDGKRIAHVHNGSPLFKTHVGSGDMLTSIVTAFTAVADDPFEAAQIGALVFSCAGQLVVKDHPNVGPATFGMYLMDYLYKVKVADIEQIADFD
ncbi:MAG: hydroxyethylthiazole kinase, partial [Lactobacillus sp.]|nr:hydroxyethylthiazole kinase [Lactobacillus sp.]